MEKHKKCKRKKKGKNKKKTQTRKKWSICDMFGVTIDMLDEWLKFF